MRKIILTLFISSLFLSCSSGKVVSYEHSQAMNTLEVALNHILTGNEKGALSAYKRSSDNFLKSADFCNLSRAGILLFFAKPISNHSEFITDAIRYAKVGSCESEKNIANFLQTVITEDNSTVFDPLKLEEPYLSFYLFRTEQNQSYLIKYIGRGDASDAVKSMMLRLLADINASSGGYEQAEKYINDAIKIDRIHSWSGNLIDDYNILVTILDGLGRDNSTVVEAIKLIGVK